MLVGRLRVSVHLVHCHTTALGCMVVWCCGGRELWCSTVSTLSWSIAA